MSVQLAALDDNAHNHDHDHDHTQSLPHPPSSLPSPLPGSDPDTQQPSVQSSAGDGSTKPATRTIYINDSEHNAIHKFASNKLRSAKYTPLDLLPKALLEQFRRVSNLYFLFVAVVSFIPNVSPYSPWASVAPLFVVVGFGFARDVYEDVNRSLQDAKQNAQKHIILDSHATLNEPNLSQEDMDALDTINLNPLNHHAVQSKNIRVGDIVLIKKGQVFPCDLLLIYSSSHDDVAYVSTANLDGESSLKRLLVAKSTSLNTAPAKTTDTDQLNADADAQSDERTRMTPEKLLELKGVVEAQNPVPALHEFSGTLELTTTAPSSSTSSSASISTTIPLNADNLLLRGSILRNTEYIYGVAVYTGTDTKVAINMRKPVSKLGTIELMLNRVVFVMFMLLVVLIIISSLCSGILQARFGADQWYMGDLKDFSGLNAGLRGLGTFLILFGTFIPSSLFVTLEFVRVVQALFIVADTRMKKKSSISDSREGKEEQREGSQGEGEGSVVARSMNLNETLGEVEHILSDKTGTLTENIMRFVACSVNHQILNTMQDEDVIENTLKSSGEDNENKEKLEELLLGMATCHSVVVEPGGVGEESDNNSNGKGNSTDENGRKRKWKVRTASKHRSKSNLNKTDGTTNSNKSSDNGKSLPEYQGQSPDEVALVTSARMYGVELVNRSIETMSIKRSGRVEDYRILAELEFTSDRKRMSIVIKCPDGKIRLYCKGADSIILGLIEDNTSASDIQRIENDINEFAKMGLRTLVYAMKVIDDTNFNAWFERYQLASNLIEGRDEAQAKLHDEIEADLNYLAITAVEDKLQDMVPETIKFLREAGIKLWVLTGDKRETAENIGYSSNLLSPSMDVIHITGTQSNQIEDQLSLVLNKFSSHNSNPMMEGVRRSSMRESFRRKLTNMGAAVSVSRRREGVSEQHVGIIIDGISLHFAIEDHPELFMDVSDLCSVVICCRVTPLQKALCVKLVRQSRKVITLAVGDGGNDVSMIQEAHIGVGIFGKEGTQAARSSDYAINEFKNLLRLIILHGRYSGIRTSGLINLSFYKNVFFTMTQVFFQFFCFWTGQTFHDQWITAAFNVVITAASPFVYGIFEKDLEESTITRFPSIFNHSKSRRPLSLLTIAEYSLVYGLWHSIVVFFGTFGLFGYLKIVFTDGRDGGLLLVGLVASTLATFMTLFKFLLHSYTWNWVVLFGIFISVVMYVALIPGSVSALGNYSMEGQLEMILRSPTFYLCFFVIATAGFVVDFLVLIYRKAFVPNIVDRLQKWENLPENRHLK